MSGCALVQLCNSCGHAGLEFVASSVTASQRRAVALMSLVGTLSPSVNAAVQALIDGGVVVVTAAGNDNSDACDTSPTSVADAIVVAATDSTDTRVHAAVA